MEAATNKVVFQLKNAKPPMSRTTDGNIVVAKNTLTACNPTPPARETALMPFDPESNDFQLLSVLSIYSNYTRLRTA